MKNIIFGLHSVEMLLQKNSDSIQQIYLLANRQDQRMEKLIKIAEKKNIEIEKREKFFLDRLADNENHQGIIAVIAETAQYDEHQLFDLLAEKNEAPFLLILDGVQDPHNLGACLRTADAAGVHAVIVPKDRAVGLTPIVRKVACGAAETVPLVQVTNLARFIEKLKKENIWIVGSAGEASDTIFKTDLKGGLAIVAGAEGEGMRRLTKEHCDFLVKIPMQGEVSSLNVSVAVGVLLFEAVRQRRL